MKKAFLYVWPILLITAVTGCVTVPLHYTPLDSKEPMALSRKASVGVFQFEDGRGWDSQVVGQRITMVGLELPIAFGVNLKADRDVKAFVAEAVKRELEARQFQVSTEGDYTQVVSLMEWPGWLKGKHLGTDRVIVGRIRYFNWVGPGFAGLLFQHAMPTGKAYVDLDITVLDPKSLTVKWSGQASSKLDSGSSWLTEPDDLGKNLNTALGEALQKMFGRADFWEALVQE